MPRRERRGGPMADARRPVAELLFVPTRPRDGSGRVELEMRGLRDKRLALPAYTSLDRLVACCGARQSWIAFDSAGMREVERLTGYDVVLLDAMQPAETQSHGGSADITNRTPRSWLESPIAGQARTK